MPRRKLIDVRLARRLLREGWKVCEVLDALRCAPLTLRRALRDPSRQLPQSGHETRPVNVRAAAELRDEYGLSLSAIARHQKVKLGKLKRALDKYDARRRKGTDA